MSPKKLPNPHITIWRALLMGLYMNTLVAFFSWLYKIFLEPERYRGWNSTPPTFPPLGMEDVLLGSGFWVLALWLLWAWQPRRKYAHWHRWLASVSFNIYLSILILLGGTALWNVLLVFPWNIIVNGVLASLLVVSWLLPVLSYRWSKKIAEAQDDLGLRMLKFGGPAGLMVAAGILGANFGLSAGRHNSLGALFALAIGFPLVAIFVAQYNAEYLWPYRPWAKEEE